MENNNTEIDYFDSEITQDENICDCSDSKQIEEDSNRILNQNSSTTSTSTSFKDADTKVDKNDDNDEEDAESQHIKNFFVINDSEDAEIKDADGISEEMLQKYQLDEEPKRKELFYQLFREFKDYLSPRLVASILHTKYHFSLFCCFQ